MLPFAKEIDAFFKKITGNTGFRFAPWPIFFAGMLLLLISTMFMFHQVDTAVSLALYLAPVWLPFLLADGALSLWLTLKRSEFINSQTYIVLEIKPPRNLVKTPLAMEAFFSSIHLSPGESTWYARSIKGAVRPWWSFEMVSFEGRVHFYVWTRANFRRIVESQMYAQYPGVQITEALDYTRCISAVPGEWSIWGCDYRKIEKDPLPIKTYIEFGLDKVQEEPEQIDPLASITEFLGSAGKGEYVWLQFIIQVHSGHKYNKLNADNKPYTWRDEGKEIVEKIRKDTRTPYVDPTTGKEMPGFPNPTKGESEKMAAIERNTSKLGFDVGARCIYLAKPDSFKPTMIAQMIGLFKPFSVEGWNGIKATAWLMIFDDYPWEIGSSKLKKRYTVKMVEAYRRRQFFHEPFSEGLTRNDIMVLSTEELATLYHIPSAGIHTPGLERVSSATGEAPANLPL
ncbi:MAG: hypothetical protein WAN50_03140 [Minisyncoccia bacterium]